MRLDALVLDIDRYDVLLGLDWLTFHDATIVCPLRQIRFPRVGDSAITLAYRKVGDSITRISAMEARRLIDTGCEAYLATVQTVGSETLVRFDLTNHEYITS